MGFNATPIQARTVIRASSAPAQTDVLWLDSRTTPATLRQYDESNASWPAVAQNPVAKKQVATSFTESFLTLDRAEAAVGGSLKPVENVDASLSDDGDHLPYPDGTMTVTVKQPIEGYSQTESISTDMPSGIVPPGDYSVTVSPGNDFTPKQNSPYDDEYIHAEASDGTCYARSISFTGYGAPVTATFNDPPDVFGWDVLTYSAETPGDSAVAVYVETAEGTELAGPVGRGESIPADPADNPRFRIDWTLGSASEIPSLSSLARRWKL